MKVSIDCISCSKHEYIQWSNSQTYIYFVQGVQTLLLEIAVQDEWLHFLVVFVSSKSYRNTKSCARHILGSMEMKSKGTAYLLWFLSIFGWLEFHRFYLHKIGTGIIWILTFGFFGLGLLLIYSH